MSKITIEIRWNNNDFIMNNITLRCSNGLTDIYCTVPQRHEFISTELYQRLLIFKMLRRSNYIFREYAKERRRVQMSFDILWNPLNIKSHAN